MATWEPGQGRDFWDSFREPLPRAMRSWNGAMSTGGGKDKGSNKGKGNAEFSYLAKDIRGVDEPVLESQRRGQLHLHQAVLAELGWNE